MTKIKIGLLGVASALLLCGCGATGHKIESPIILEPETMTTEESNASDSSKETDSASSEETSQAPSEPEDDTLPPAEGMVRSHLTNEWVDADVASRRPIAVMTPNESKAIPHYNLSKASVLYEAPVEGGMTRMMALYEDWTALEKIGNVRSLRLYYGYWAQEWDAFLVHFGGPFFIDDFIAQKDTHNINGLSDDEAFFRSTDRKAPHNAYATADGILKVIDRKNYPLEYRGLADTDHYQFTPKAEPNTLDQYTDTISASVLDMTSCYSKTRPYFEYNEEDGLYYRSQHLSGSTDGPHIDAVTGDQLTFKNILVQKVTYEDLGKGYLAIQCHDNTQDGWYFTNGKGIHVTWEKNSDFGATRYYDDNGKEITLNTGKTMVCIIKNDSSFTADGSLVLSN